MTPSRPWWLALFITAGVLAVVSIFVIFLELGPLTISPLAAIFGFSALIDGGFVFPGLVISMVTNGVILWRRRPAVTRRADRAVLTLVYVILGLVIVEGIIESINAQLGTDQFLLAVFIAVPLWIVLIVASIIAALVLATGNSTINLSAATAEVGDPLKTFGPVEPGAKP
jgi:hypothetical protein